MLYVNDGNIISRCFCVKIQLLNAADVRLISFNIHTSLVGYDVFPVDG